ncbi:hypothetical protein MKW94_008624 [Papaver nudicaule]|uniref:Uncharacterized protein n=1 Tax=Papaver nudicaule TaxID=74823 RepID=A0AA41V0Q5_PAPNU|nr:hypothetical protein [Papaver nudicaule]
MGTRNVKVFICLSLVVALLLFSYEVSAVKDLAETTLQVEETTEQNGEAPKYGVSLVGVSCGTKSCCESGSSRFGTFCTRCCR